MALIGLWLLGLGSADLMRWRPEGSLSRGGIAWAAAAAPILGILLVGGAGIGKALLLTAGMAVLIGGWLVSSRAAVRACQPGADPSTSRELLALGWLLASGVGVLAASPYSPPLEGSLSGWYSQVPLAILQGIPIERAVAGLGAGVFLLATANTAVRLLLSAAGSSPQDSEKRLKGGRLLGPMERLFIFGLGLAGALTAAAVIVAAKGLLRFPELQAHDDDTNNGTRRIDELTEYFLIGSMSSWLLALVAVALV